MYELELGCPSFGLFTFELLLLLRQTARVVGGSRDQKPRLCDATESLDERTADVFSSLAEQSCHMCKWTFKALHLLLHGEVKRTCFVHGS
jgi:hypothetical protein